MNDQQVFQGIRTGLLFNSSELQKLIEDKTRLALTTIKTGFYHSAHPGKREQQHYKFEDQGPLNQPKAEWLHLLPYCRDEGIEEFVNEVIVHYPNLLGDVIFVMWNFDKQKAMYYLTGIHEFDQNFNTIQCRKTPYSMGIAGTGEINQQAFSKLYIEGLQTDIGKDTSQLNDLIANLMVKPEEPAKGLKNAQKKKEDRIIKEAYKSINKERSQLIFSGSLTEAQAEELLDFLGSFVVKESPETNDYHKRFLHNYFVEGGGYDGPELKYRKETKQFIDLLEYVSKDKFAEIAAEIIKHTNFWAHDEFNRISVKRGPELYLDAWNDLFAIVGQLETRRNNREQNVPKVKINPNKIFKSLTTMYEIAKNDPKQLEILKKTCIALIAYQDASIKNLVQEILSTS